MKTKLVWRLGKLPSVEELSKLVNDKIITNEEMRDILFNSETEEEVDKKNLESEIKFLRELVTKLSGSAKIVETVRTIQPTYISQPWYAPYYTWVSSTSGTSNTGCGIGTLTTTSGYSSDCSLTNTGSTTSYATSTGNTGSVNCYSVGSTGDFSDIKTF